MSDPISLSALSKLLSDKGAPTAAALTVIAALLAASMKSTFPLIEKLLEMLTKNQRQVQRTLDARTANLMLKIGQQRPTPPAQRKLRQRQRHATERLEQAREMLKRQKRAASWAAFVNGLLIAAQYLVGATLASSFIQRSLSPNLTGTLGVLVVVASTIQQRYSPEVIASAAKTRAAKLHRIIVQAEDELVEANQGGDGEEFQRVSNMLSQMIVWIETSYTEPPSSTRPQVFGGLSADQEPASS